MRYFKGATIFAAFLCFSVVLSSNTSAFRLFNNDNAHAFININDNFNKLSDKIKKVCPTYQENTDSNLIKGMVTNILKACLPNSHNPPTTPNPNPDPNLQYATMDFNVRLVPDFPSNVNVVTNIVLQWFNETSGGNEGVREYNLQGNSDDGPSVHDEMQVPVGYTYLVILDDGPIIIDKSTRNCSGIGKSCTGTMQEGTEGTYEVLISLNTLAPPPT